MTCEMLSVVSLFVAQDLRDELLIKYGLHSNSDWYPSAKVLAGLSL